MSNTRFHNDIISLFSVIYTVVPFGIAPTWRALPPGLRQDLFGFIAVRSAIVAVGVRVSRRALVAGFLDVGIGDCGGGE